LNKKLFETHGVMGIPKVNTRPPTVPMNFALHTEKRAKLYKVPPNTNTNNNNYIENDSSSDNNKKRNEKNTILKELNGNNNVKQK